MQILLLRVLLVVFVLRLYLLFIDNVCLAKIKKCSFLHTFQKLKLSESEFSYNRHKIWYTSVSNQSFELYEQQHTSDSYRRCHLF